MQRARGRTFTRLTLTFFFAFGCQPLPQEVSHVDSSLSREHLGATYDENSEQLTFKVYSNSATRIDLSLYRAARGEGVTLVRELRRTRDKPIWEVTLARQELESAGLSADALYYGFRAWGPNWPSVPDFQPGTAAGFVADVDGEGNRFNPNKLLSDPYGLELSHDPIYPENLDGRVYASGEHRTIDSEPWAPKSVFFRSPVKAIQPKPSRALVDDVIYEVHVKGLTQNDPSIPEALRGTYLGAARKAPALAELGITAVEFLPLQESQNDANDVAPTDPTGDNYWGYMTLSYFAPDRRYSSDKSPGGPAREFQEMVRAFHQVGIKVLVDVVYNHTGEGALWGGDPFTANILSYRGLDNASYYSLAHDRRFYWDNTGTGANYNSFHPVAQDLIVDSLRYWRDVLGVDGFRFDLASVLGNTCQHGCFAYDKLHPGTALNRILRELPPRAATGGPGVDLIAEPWAIGGNSYQVGEFPGGFAEWNGKFRDALRRHQNDPTHSRVTLRELFTRLTGSPDLFGNDGRAPAHSVNFLVAHDGLTLRDLYACNAKHNDQAWPFGPSDGGEDHNHSWDQGGDAAEQRKAARTGMALLTLSAGTPMFTGGDEVLRTQRCNNNTYNLDSLGNWLGYDWTAEQRDFRNFTQGLLALRGQHRPLRPRNFDPQGQAWLLPSGAPVGFGELENPNHRGLMLLLHEGPSARAPAVLLAYNGNAQPMEFQLPNLPNNREWRRAVDTCLEKDGAIADPSRQVPVARRKHLACGRSAAFFVEHARTGT